MRLLITLILLSFISADAIAQGDLLIYPKRVLFEGPKRAETLNLSNVGKDTATYKITFCAIPYERKWIVSANNHPQLRPEFF